MQNVPAFGQWARATPRAGSPLRRGAWYRVLSLSEHEVVLEVNHRSTIVPRTSVEIAQARPGTWAIVGSAEGRPYLVCPACSDRALFAGYASPLRCMRCGGWFPLEIDRGADLEDEAAPIDILLVEDRQDDVLLTLRALERAKIQNRVQVVSDGAAALVALADAPPPDLVLLDLNLPQLDGRDVLIRIRELPELGSLPVVVLTASDQQHEQLASLAADAFLTKPVDFERLKKVVRTITGLAWAIVRVK